MALSPYQQEVLYGSLLGDGHLEAYTGPKGTTYRYILNLRQNQYIYIGSRLYFMNIDQIHYIPDSIKPMPV